MRDDELCYMPATEALARFRDKSLSPVELMAAVIARAEQTEPKLNAITYRHFDEAMDSARKAEARYAKGGGPARWRGCRSRSRTRATSRASPRRTDR